MKLVDLLFHLLRAGGDCKRIFGAVVTWLGWVLEQSPWMQTATDDGLKLPVPKGNHRPKRLDRILKQACIRESTGGGVAKTTGHAPCIVKRFSKSLVPIVLDAFRWDVTEAGRELAHLKGVLSFSGFRMIGLACDATRLSGLDTLFGTLSFPRMHTTSFCIPQACASPILPEQTK